MPYGVVVLALVLVLMPVFTAAWHQQLNMRQAVVCVALSALTVLVLTIMLSAAFQWLSQFLPALNPYMGAAHEPLEAGLFSMLLGLLVAMTVTCLGEGWWLWRHVQH